MKVRLIGLETCKKCQFLKKNYSEQSLDFEYWDANEKELQDTLDLMKIEDVPVIQIVDDSENILWSTDPKIYPNGVSVAKIKHQIKKITKKVK